MFGLKYVNNMSKIITCNSYVVRYNFYNPRTIKIAILICYPIIVRQWSLIHYAFIHYINIIVGVLLLYGVFSSEF